jgi:hypothetical protein
MSESIEELFLKASKDNKYYIQFIEILFDSYVYIPLTEGSFSVWKNQSSNMIVPFFFSLNILKKSCFTANQGIENEYIKLEGKDFFRKIPNLCAVLNPNSTLTKEFSLEEIAWLKERENLSWILTAASESKILLYQPKIQPLNIFTILKKIFKAHESVDGAAYSRISISESKKVEYDLVGLKISGDFNKTLNMTDELKNYRDEFENLKFVDVNQKNKITDYLDKNKFFYKKTE